MHRPSGTRWRVLIACALAGLVTGPPGAVRAAEPGPATMPVLEPSEESQPGGESPVEPPLPLARPLDREELIAAVLARNPGVEAARQAWRAAREQLPQARSLDDPMAGYSLAPLSIGSNDVDFGHELRLSQRLPYPGTLRLRGDVVTAEAAAAEQRIEVVRQQLAELASGLFDRYWLTARSLEITAVHRRLLEDFQRVATSRYATGLAPQQAPIQAEVEAAHLLHREVVLRSEQRTVAARINALLRRDPGAPLPPPPAELGRPAPPEPPEARAAAAAGRPEVRAQRAEIEARRAGVDLEKLGFYPGFEVMTSYSSMWNMTEHRWMVGVGVNLPVRRQRIRAAVAEAEARLAADESELARLEDEVREAVEVAALALDEALHVVHLYENRVLPAARDQVAAARAGFETGANTMLALIDAERSLRTAELDVHQAVAEAFSRRAELDRALGRTPSPAAGDAAAQAALDAEEENR